MHHIVTTAALASLALLAAPGPTDAVSLTFSPEPGTRIERSITVESSVVSGDLSVVMGGQEVPQMYLPDITVEVEGKLSVQITDRFIAPNDDLLGYPCVREVTGADQSVVVGLDGGGFEGIEDSETESDASSPLQGTPFRIGVDGDGEVVAAWAEPDDSLDDALLDDLRPGLDLAGLLPEDPVEIGARWKADAAVLAEILRPSGDLSWEWSGEGADEMSTDSTFSLSGDLELQLLDVTGDDAELARIEVTGKLIEAETSATDLEKVPVADGSATQVTTTQYDVKGEIVWNVRLGVLHSVELELVGEGDMIITRDSDQPGATYESTMMHTREVKISVKCRLVD